MGFFCKHKEEQAERRTHDGVLERMNLERRQHLEQASSILMLLRLLDYEVGEVTAAATFYLAEIYADFSKDLKESERPAGLSALEREEYELALEDQAYPFEEKAIATYQSNLELVPRGVYNEWIEKSLQRLAKLVPARYDKPEEESPVITSADSYVFVIGHPGSPAPQPAAAASAQAGGAKQDEKPAAGKEVKQAEGPKPAADNTGATAPLQ